LVPASLRTRRRHTEREMLAVAQKSPIFQSSAEIVLINLRFCTSRPKTSLAEMTACEAPTGAVPPAGVRQYGSPGTSASFRQIRLHRKFAPSGRRLDRRNCATLHCSSYATLRQATSLVQSTDEKPEEPNNKAPRGALLNENSSGNSADYSVGTHLPSL